MASNDVVGSFVDEHPYALIVLSVAFFEATFRLSGIVLRSLVGRPQFVLDKGSVDAVVAQGPSYVCSLVHAIVTSLRGLNHIAELAFAPPEAQLYKPPSTEDPYHRSSVSVEITNYIFLGYLLYDLYHVLRCYPKLGGPDIVAHHLVFVACSVINGSYQILPFAFAWLIVGEVSTIFLNLRWFLLKTGRANTHALRVTQLLFAAAFFAFRVVAYVAGVVHLIWSKDDVVAGLVVEPRVPPLFLGITLSFIAAGCVLNLVWFRKILRMASSTDRRRTDPSTAGKAKAC